MAKIGTLYLNGGTWHGSRVLSASYVRDATTGQVRAEGYALRYGYQWWVTSVGRGHAAFAAVGFGGQLIEVVPSLRLVAVYSTYVPNNTAGTDSRAYMNITSTLVAKAERQ
jgi:CubicO group peptidase (beta-lactamase class C family)